MTSKEKNQESIQSVVNKNDNNYVNVTIYLFYYLYVHLLDKYRILA